MAKTAPGRGGLERELDAFDFSGSGMAAARGYHDDLVMAALLAVFACAQALRTDSAKVAASMEGIRH